MNFETIKAEREFRGLSINDLSSISGVNPDNIKSIEEKRGGSNKGFNSYNEFFGLRSYY